MSIVFSKAEEEKTQKVLDFLNKNHTKNPEKRDIPIKKISLEVDETPNTIRRILEKIDEIQNQPIRILVVGSYVRTLDR